MNIKNLEGGRASKAYKYVSEVQKAYSENTDLKYPGAYKSYAKKIPMLIKTNGLGATFAFVLSKAKNDPGKKEYAYYLLHEQTYKWLQSDEKKHLLEGLDVKHRNMPGILVNLESNKYRAVTAEVISLFNWLRRFAEGLIEAEETEEA
ncbi:MAG: type III-B CRISPR module-associated protein Cmr5 [Bacteroidota bacterium]